MKTRRVAFQAILLAWVGVSCSCVAVDKPGEGSLKPFLGAPVLDQQPVFKGQRFPNVVVSTKGTIIATYASKNYRVRRSDDGGKTWADVQTIADPGFQGGGTTVDETTGDILVFVEEKHPPAPLTVYRSKDDGKTWEPDDITVELDSRGHVTSMHMNDNGITLRHGKHKGRLVRPARYYGKGNRPASLFPTHYTNLIYSDDGGKTWTPSEPFPEFGTGEACVVELSDGRLYYNTRRHWAPEGKSPLRRWDAWSEDGGATWKNVGICEILPDGPQNTTYGCMGGLVRLPVKGKDILIYSNCDSPAGRHHGTVWASFDGGRTWPIKRLVFEGAFAYSSMTAGRPGTSTEGQIHLHYEGGPQGGGSTMATFNLSWVMKGEKTGDGEIPGWLPNK